MKVINPATEKVIAVLTEDGPASIRRKFSAAKESLAEWKAGALENRISKVRRFGVLLAKKKEKLASILTSEMGKPIAQSRREIEGVEARIDFFLAEIKRALADEVVHREKGLEERISREPLGVIANISAWNYPYFVGTNVFLPALLTGNAVLYKPSEFATLTGREIAGLLYEAGIPDSVFTLLVGGGRTGAELVKLPLDGVFFTGSYATGRRIAATTGPRMIKMQLELGGKDPIYVCDDVDIGATAAAVADGAFYNTGQSCCSVERIYVHRAIHDRFIEAFVGVVTSFVVGDPTDVKTYIGPVARGSHLEVLRGQVRDAVAKGAKLLCGGKRLDRPGYFFAPTVLAGVDHSMKVMREETFGPVIGIQSVADDREAQALMNDTEYGLTAGVYSKDRARAERILAGANAGSAYWNCCDRVSPRLPWSGRGHSGIGTTLSFEGLRTFLRPKAWHVRGVK